MKTDEKAEAFKGTTWCLQISDTLSTVRSSVLVQAFDKTPTPRMQEGFRTVRWDGSLLWTELGTGLLEGK